MKTISVSGLTHNLREVLDQLEREGDRIAITRRERVIATLTPTTSELRASDAFADVYGIIPEEEGEHWINDMRSFEHTTGAEEIRDPWES